MQGSPGGAMGSGMGSPDMSQLDEKTLQSMMGGQSSSGGTGGRSGGLPPGLAQMAGGGAGGAGGTGKIGGGDGIGSGMGNFPGAGKAGAGGGAGKQKPARPVGTFAEELIKYPAQDIWAGIKSLFDIKSILGINPQTDTPEQQAKKKQIHQRYNRLTQEQQQVAQAKYQERMRQKQQQEQEDQMKKQREAQEKSSSIQAPSSPKKGAVGPGGSKKQKATTQLQNDRKTLSKVQGAG